MGRKADREQRQAYGIEDLVHGVLENWGIEMHRYDDEPGGDERPFDERFTPQIGEGESVEYREVYHLIMDVAKEAYNRGREVTDVPLLAEYRPLRGLVDDLAFDRTLPVSEESWKREHRDYEGSDDYSELSKRRPRPVVVEWEDPTETPGECIARLNTEAVEHAMEAQRLASIIRRAYGTQGWDIGSVKNLLLPGLDGYHKTLLTQQEKCKHSDTRVNRAGFTECNDCGRVWAKAPAEPIHPGESGIRYTETCSLTFAPEASRDAWWLYLTLIGEHDEEIATLILNDQDASKLSDSLEEKVREGRKTWS